MVEENLMKTIIKTFVDHLRHRDLHGCFQFDRYTAQQAFKFGRVQSLIGDLKWGTAHSLYCFTWYSCQDFYVARILISQRLYVVCRYVLISRPSDWTDQLRFKFLEGLDAFLELLKCMQVTQQKNPLICAERQVDFECFQLTDVTVSQGMDPVIRQVGQHIEMEPEWEAAFTLQMKLTNIITMIQDWCSTDVSN